VAVKSENLKLTELLTELGADLDALDNNGCSALFLASSHGFKDIVEFLGSKHKANVNTPNALGWTPLYAASRDGHIEVIRCLHSLGADINVQNDKGWTPFFAAVHNKSDVKVLNTLKELGADVNAPNVSGWTPLFQSAKWGDTKMVNVLLGMGADKSISNIKGQTPLDVATVESFDEVVTLLS
jgi:ankyrin repeat protein